MLSSVAASGPFKVRLRVSNSGMHSSLHTRISISAVKASGGCGQGVRRLEFLEQDHVVFVAVIEERAVGEFMRRWPVYVADFKAFGQGPLYVWSRAAIARVLPVCMPLRVNRLFDTDPEFFSGVDCAAFGEETELDVSLIFCGLRGVQRQERE